MIPESLMSYNCITAYNMVNQLTQIDRMQHALLQSSVLGLKFNLQATPSIESVP